jgi:hypothetical protein
MCAILNTPRSFRIETATSWCVRYERGRPLYLGQDHDSRSEYSKTAIESQHRVPSNSGLTLSLRISGL